MFWKNETALNKSCFLIESWIAKHNYWGNNCEEAKELIKQNKTHWNK